MPFYVLQNPDVTLAIEAFDFVHACYTACRESFAPIRNQLNLHTGDFIASANTVAELKDLCNTPAIYILTLENKLHVYDPRKPQPHSQSQPLPQFQPIESSSSPKSETRYDSGKS